MSVPIEMKITKEKLQQIIKEEVNALISERRTTPEDLVRVIWKANNALVKIIGSIDDEDMKQRLHNVRAIMTDTAARYQGIGGSMEDYGTYVGGQQDD